MGKFATKQSFGGQRASVGRVVLVAQAELEDGGEGVAKATGRVDLVAGQIDQIHEETDQPVIRACNDEIYHPDYGTAATFVPTSTEAEAEALKPGEWTWAVRV